MNRSYRRLSFLAAAPLILATGCESNPIASDEPAVSSVVITIAGGNTPTIITWNTANNSVTPSSIVLPASSVRTLTAVFLKSDGSVESKLTEANFRLDVTFTGTGVAVTKPSNLTASLATSASVNGSLRFSIEHIVEGHREYGPSGTVTVTSS
jgi:hypothetical protein